MLSSRIAKYVYLDVSVAQGFPYFLIVVPLASRLLHPFNLSLQSQAFFKNVSTVDHSLSSIHKIKVKSYHETVFFPFSQTQPNWHQATANATLQCRRNCLLTTSCSTQGCRWPSGGWTWSSRSGWVDLSNKLLNGLGVSIAYLVDVPPAIEW